MDTLVKPLRMLRSGRSSELWLVTLAGLGKAAVEKKFRPELVGDPVALFSALRAASEARDEALIRVFDIDLSGSTVRQWMEHVPGESVTAAVQRARRAGEAMPLGVAARIVTEAARGLHRAHEHGRVTGRGSIFVHGAMSADSVLLGLSGEVRVLELGAGSVVLRSVEPLHLAPELAQGRAFNRRVDVFALGAMLRDLIAGARGSPELSQVIDRAIARNPDARFETADELADAIRESTELADRTTIAAWLGGLMGELDTQPHRAIIAPATTAIGALHETEFEETTTTTTKKTALEPRTIPRGRGIPGPRKDGAQSTASLERLELGDSTDPSNAGMALDPGTATQDRVDIDHTISREVSGSGSQAIAVQEARAERRGRLRKRRPRSALMWTLAAACVPLIALFAWIARSKLVEQNAAARPAVPIEVRAFGSDRRFDRAVPLPAAAVEPIFAWGRVELPAVAPAVSVAKTVRARSRARRETVAEVKTVEVAAPPQKTTGRVSVAVLRGGRSSRMLVYVDGKPLLQSPSAIELSPGAHVLEIRPKGKPAIRKNVDVKAGADFEVTLDAGEDVD